MFGFLKVALAVALLLIAAAPAAAELRGKVVSESAALVHVPEPRLATAKARSAARVVGHYLAAPFGERMTRVRVRALQRVSRRVVQTRVRVTADRATFEVRVVVRKRLNGAVWAYAGRLRQL